MTAEEVVEYLKDRYMYMSTCISKEVCLNNNEAIDIAIDTLIWKRELEKRGFTEDVINNYKAFEDECIRKDFNFKSLIAAREKMTPKHLIVYSNNAKFCPCCDNELTEFIDKGYLGCPYCLQEIDWDEGKTE